MSDLQDALNREASFQYASGDWELIQKAAAKYANPDYEAATVVTGQLRYIKTSDDWDDKIEDITREAVNAALDITE